MKITKVHLLNFEAHENTAVEFTDFTAILGETNEGKSSIIRAILWCLCNTYDGDSDGIVRHGEDYCEVTVWSDEGKSVTRVRDERRRKNLCILKEEGQEDQVIGKLGTGYNKDVGDFFNFRQVEIFGSGQVLNIAKQLEPALFFAESRLKRAQMIGALADTEVTDLAIDMANKDKMNVAMAEKMLQEQKSKELTRLGELRDEKAEVDNFLEEAYPMYRSVKARAEVVDQMKSKIDSLKGNVLSYDSYICKVSELDHDAYLQKIAEIEANIHLLQPIHSQSSSIKDAIGRIESLDAKCRKSLSSDEYNSMIEQINNLEVTLGNIQQINSLFSAVSHMSQDYKEQLSILENLMDKDIDSLIREIEDAESTVRESLSQIEKVKSISLDVSVRSERMGKGIVVVGNLEHTYKCKCDEFDKLMRDEKVCPLCMQKTEGVHKHE